MANSPTKTGRSLTPPPSTQYDTADKNKGPDGSPLQCKHTSLKFHTPQPKPGTLQSCDNDRAFYTTRSGRNVKMPQKLTL